MKKIHEFKLNKIEVVDIEEVSTNEKGETVKTVKKGNKEIARTFFLRKPSRPMNDDANLFFGIKVSEGVKAGLLTIPQLDKRNTNDGGILGEKDNKRYNELLIETDKLETEYQSFGTKKEEQLTEEEKTKKKDVLEKITNNRLELNRLQTFIDSAYDHTAEIRARNLTLTWWLLNISYEERDGKFIPFFGEGTYEEKLAKYDQFVEEEDEFTVKAILKFLAYVSLWFNNRSLTSDDFNKFEQLMNKQEETEKPKDVSEEQA